MHSIVVLNGKENIQYSIIFQRFCRMHRPSSLYRERIFKVKKMPEVFFQKYASEIHKSDFLFLPTDRIRTLYHIIGYCAFLNKVSDPDSGGGGVGRRKSVEEKKKTEFTLAYIYLNGRANKLCI